ncbi:MAG: alpha/beta fold hydrolase [Acidimicrobiales bacterium]
MPLPETHYALRQGHHVGYQVWGSGPIDVLEFNNGLMISIDETPDEPNWLRCEERLSSFCRLIRFDALGLGLSDPLPAGAAPSIASWAEDAVAVLDHAGSARPAVLGSTGGSMAAMWLAAHHPERVASLVLVNASARVGRDEGYEIGVAEDLVASAAANVETRPDDPAVPQDIAIFAPSLAHRVGFREWWGRAARRGASPATAIAFNVVTFTADLRAELPEIGCPTLVVARTEAYAGLVEHGRYLSRHIAGARLVEFPGADLLLWAGQFDQIIDEIEEFLTGHRSSHPTQRALATVLFTDIVDSTTMAAAAGDRQWRGILDEYDVNVHRLLARYDGIHVKNTGDGSLARFAGPAQAVRCAMAMVETARNFGVEIRVGLHAGEVELRGDDIGGLAVHIASRVNALAGPNEVLTTGTVRDLVVGSGIVFEDRGRHTLKGVPEEWQLLVVTRP